MTEQTRYGIAELADAGGVSRRTIRYYVQRRLLTSPTGTGRGKHYTKEHLETLIRIRNWQEAGISLAEIESRLVSRSEVSSGGVAPPESPSDQPVYWAKHHLHPGVELMVQNDAALDTAQIERIVKAVRAALGGAHE